MSAATVQAASGRVLADLGGVAAAEVALFAAIAGLGGPVIRSAAAMGLGVVICVSFARAGLAALAIRRLRILARAARAGEGAMVPSARALRVSRRLPFAVAAGGVATTALLAPWLVSDAQPALVLIGLSLVASAPVEAVTREPISAWVACLPRRDVPDEPALPVAAARAFLAAAPPLGAILSLAAIGGLVHPALILVLVAPAGLLGVRRAYVELASRREVERVAQWAGSAVVDGASAKHPPISPRPHTGAGLRALEDVEVFLASSAEVLATDDAARDAVEREAQVRSRFMAAMGHELRSPLNAIVGFAQLLEEGTEGPLRPAQIESVSLIRRSAEELLLLLTDILDSSKLEAGRLQLRRAWTPSVEILTQATAQATRIVEGTTIVIDARLQPGLPPVYGDRQRIVQSVVNLFRHLARGMTRGKLVLRARVTRTSEGDALRVEVIDPARSMSPEDANRVFESFGEARDPSARRVSGLGLATSLARQLVRLHDGDAWCSSDADEGTTLTVSLPLEGPTTSSAAGRTIEI